VKFREILWFLVNFRYFCFLMWSGWSRAPQNHQYSYRNTNVFSRGPQGTLQVARKMIFTCISLKCAKKCDFPAQNHFFRKMGAFWEARGSKFYIGDPCIGNPYIGIPYNYRESLYRGSLYRESLYRESLYRDSPYRGSLYRESLHKDSQTSQFLINFSLAGSISHQLPVILSHYE